MQWTEITIQTAAAGIEDVAAALTAAGFDDLVLEDQAEFEEFLDQNRAYWDYIDESLQQQMQGISRIKLYLPEDAEADLARLNTLVQTLKARDPQGRLGDLTLSTTALPQTDWEQSWKENYPPQPIGSRLTVLPYWISDADIGDRLPVILDPGLTFGTGAHPSTQMVIEAMEALLPEKARCLDLGSGSGILSIAALRLGAESAVGVDIDPKAEDIARQNAAYNGFAAPVFTALTGNVTADRTLMEQLSRQTYDLVLVNIVADVIIHLAPVLPRFLTPQSVLICSGILDTRLSDVTAALRAASLTVVNTRAKEDWHCIIAKRSLL